MSKSKKIIVIIAVISILCSMFIIPVNAVATNDMYRFTLPISQPTYSDRLAYIEIMYNDCKDSEVILISMSCPDYYSYDMDTFTFLENLVCVDIYDDHIRILPYAHSPQAGYIISAFYVNTDGESDFLEAKGNNIQGNSYIYRYYDHIDGFHLYGIDQADYHTGVENNPNFVCIYGSDAMAYAQLKTIVSLLQRNNNAIIDNADKNASEIQQNQDENTQDVIDNQNQLQQNEKDEAQQSGQGSVDDISGAIEDKSAGFISSLGNLIQTMSYTGTECAWKFPAIKLPAIEGVMPEYKLTEEQPIDFEFWVEKIPSQVLLLIRSLLTIALIVYCFKELYSTISYVLTLKGGGNGE